MERIKNNLPELPEGCIHLNESSDFKDTIGYAVHPSGSIYTCINHQYGFYPTWRKLKTRRHKNTGYWNSHLQINGKSKTYLLHRIIAICFVPNPDNKPCVNHIDGNRSNNEVSNLEWCTYKENTRHAMKLGTFHVGETVRTSFLKEHQVKEIKSMREQGIKFKDIADSFGVCVGTIESIVYKRSWKHLI